MNISIQVNRGAELEIGSMALPVINVIAARRERNPMQSYREGPESVVIKMYEDAGIPRMRSPQITLWQFLHLHYLTFH